MDPFDLVNVYVPHPGMAKHKKEGLKGKGRGVFFDEESFLRDKLSSRRRWWACYAAMLRELNDNGGREGTGGGGGGGGGGEASASASSSPPHSRFHDVHRSLHPTRQLHTYMMGRNGDLYRYLRAISVEAAARTTEDEETEIRADIAQERRQAGDERGGEEWEEGEGTEGEERGSRELFERHTQRPQDQPQDQERPNKFRHATEGARLDYFLANDAGMRRAVDGWVVANALGSDHRPVGMSLLRRNVSGSGGGRSGSGGVGSSGSGGGNGGTAWSGARSGSKGENGGSSRRAVIAGGDMNVSRPEPHPHCGGELLLDQAKRPPAHKWNSSHIAPDTAIPPVQEDLAALLGGLEITFWS